MSKRHQRVRERAYRLWEAEGYGHGRDAAQWLRAEAVPVLAYYLLVAIILGIILWLVDIKPPILNAILTVAAVICGVLGLVQLLGGTH